ncbi:hypothetical protein GOFOIKOB_5449 [Methylobacterium tardum]|jgi:hypothetical protein|uniref:Uncharacterized protein n=1 Tax=Methylobacterium tardum TaxID=374432 RepID=A0AA37TBS0_9HYPH|nr:hypothetical protein [Methylobacterium tardum]URD36066.1 hypothetical protein M6G65_27165 [Methylobacterium tardum]GJE52378.1 hypothetical protein GOFOIKOB_5449 [Methylobacterium tardum]GLS68985.1 hypothetical protein GCM10007890_09970 [Methylobacterium tardum]
MPHQLLTIRGIVAALNSAGNTMSVTRETGGAGRANSYGHFGDNIATESSRTEDKNIGSGGTVGDSSGAAPNGHSAYGNVARVTATSSGTAPGTTDRR